MAAGQGCGRPSEGGRGRGQSPPEPPGGSGPADTLTLSGGNRLGMSVWPPESGENKTVLFEAARVAVIGYGSHRKPRHCPRLTRSGAGVEVTWCTWQPLLGPAGGVCPKGAARAALCTPTPRSDYRFGCQGFSCQEGALRANSPLGGRACPLSLVSDWEFLLAGTQLPSDCSSGPRSERRQEFLSRGAGGDPARSQAPLWSISGGSTCRSTSSPRTAWKCVTQSDSSPSPQFGGRNGSRPE